MQFWRHTTKWQVQFAELSVTTYLVVDQSTKNLADQKLYC